MVYAFGPHDQIEEIDLTDDTALRRPQNQVRELKLLSYQKSQN